MVTPARQRAELERRAGLERRARSSRAIAQLIADRRRQERRRTMQTRIDAARCNHWEARFHAARNSQKEQTT